MHSKSDAQAEMKWTAHVFPQMTSLSRDKARSQSKRTKQFDAGLIADRKAANKPKQYRKGERNKRRTMMIITKVA